jgi:peroxiredoxin
MTMTIQTTWRWATRTLLGAALAVCASVSGGAAATSAAAPDFTLRTADGRNLRLQELRGQVVMVNFWASWCAPCRVEMPHLNKLSDKYHSSGFTLLGVNVDEDPRNATSAATKMGLTFPVLLDADKRVVKLYGVATMPSTVLIDRDGRMRYLHGGYREGYEETYDKQVRELLKE